MAVSYEITNETISAENQREMLALKCHSRNQTTEDLLRVQADVSDFLKM